MREVEPPHRQTNKRQISTVELTATTTATTDGLAKSSWWLWVVCECVRVCEGIIFYSLFLLISLPLRLFASSSLLHSSFVSFSFNWSECNRIVSPRIWLFMYLKIWCVFTSDYNSCHVCSWIIAQFSLLVRMLNRLLNNALFSIAFFHILRLTIIH